MSYGYAAHPALGAYVSPFYSSGFVGMRGAGDQSPASNIGAPEGNLAGSINLGPGLEVTGRLSAAFLGAIVLALVAFHIVTKGIQF